MEPAILCTAAGAISEDDRTWCSYEVKEVVVMVNVPRPPLVQAPPCPSTGACLTVIFQVFSDHSFRGQKCNVTGLCCDRRGKRGNCNLMLFVLM